ncbi:PEPxxWA-CTERM sorting domain-containing protein [Glacieibacterium frigidum]|uniref:PEPxxWA-CTERM sorting domain-containing protein n=1 Tax=Glacieibacterium frigidum TaxID=2593303 RepID=UPI001F238F62|nr:PEPxxWA-CTERM sorting domain-containing protein [Glacieibacterium frigidum]
MISAFRISTITVAAALTALTAVPATAAPPSAGTSVVPNDNFYLTLLGYTRFNTYTLFAASTAFGSVVTFGGAGYNGQDITVYSGETTNGGETIAEIILRTPENFLFDAEINGDVVVAYNLIIGTYSPGDTLDFVSPLTPISQFAAVSGAAGPATIDPRTSLSNGDTALTSELIYSTGSYSIPISSIGIDTFYYSVNYAPLAAGVPEPGTWALMIAGFGLVGAGARRHRRAVKAA